MKLDNSNLFETLSQIRSNQYSALYTAVAKKEPQSATGTVEKPAEGSAEKTAQAKTLVFDNMTRKQLSDWLTRGLDSGKIPAEQEQAFRVLLYSGKTESSDEQATTDNQAIDFTAKAKDALSSAVQRNDKSSILFWANAMATMNQFQGKEK